MIEFGGKKSKLIDDNGEEEEVVEGSGTGKRIREVRNIQIWRTQLQMI